MKWVELCFTWTPSTSPCFRRIRCSPHKILDVNHGGTILLWIPRGMNQDRSRLPCERTTNRFREAQILQVDWQSSPERFSLWHSHCEAVKRVGAWGHIRISLPYSPLCAELPRKLAKDVTVLVSVGFRRETSVKHKQPLLRSTCPVPH